MMRLQKYTLVLFGIVLLAGCASRPLPPVHKPQPESGQAQGQATPLPSGQAPQIEQPNGPGQEAQQLPPSKPAQVSSSAVMTLLHRADSKVQAGDLSQAVSILQRALNIEPRNPFIYQRMAAVRLAQKQPDQAEALASKSNSLAVNNPFIQADNWSLIAHARRQAGDKGGEQRAAAKVKKLRLRSAALQ